MIFCFNKILKHRKEKNSAEISSTRNNKCTVHVDLLPYETYTAVKGNEMRNLYDSKILFKTIRKKYFIHSVKDVIEIKYSQSIF